MLINQGGVAFAAALPIQAKMASLAAATSGSTAFGATPSLASTIVLFMVSDRGAAGNLSAGSVTATAGGVAMTRIANGVVGGMEVALYVATGAATATVAYAGGQAGAGYILWCFEVANLLATSSALDGAVQGNNDTSATVQPGSTTPALANGVAFTTSVGFFNSSTGTPPGFTGVGGSVSGNNATIDAATQVQTAAAAFNPAWTNANAGSSALYVFSFALKHA